MRIRPCREADLPALLDVFYRTVHTACAGDYTPAQLSAWAPETPDTARWAEKLRSRPGARFLAIRAASMGMVPLPQKGSQKGSFPR